MNIERKYKLQKKRLKKSQDKINKLQGKLDNEKSISEKQIEKLRLELKILKIENEKYASLMNETEKTRQEWLKQIDELKNKNDECSILIRQLKTFRKKMNI